MLEPLHAMRPTYLRHPGLCLQVKVTFVLRDTLKVTLLSSNAEGKVEPDKISSTSSLQPKDLYQFKVGRPVVAGGRDLQRLRLGQHRWAAMHAHMPCAGQVYSLTAACAIGVPA